MSHHIKCEDCGTCRSVPAQNWCPECNYWSCERGPDCGITHAQVPFPTHNDKDRRAA